MVSSLKLRPNLNLLLYPEPVKFERRNPLVTKRFQCLEGCVRQEAAYDIPTFDSNNDDPLICLSCGSGNTSRGQQPVYQISFETDEEAIEIANETRCGLQMAVFTSSLKRCFFCSARLRTGKIVINETTDFLKPQWLFGGGEGTKSGYGRSGGRFTIDDVTHLKSVCIDLAKTL